MTHSLNAHVCEKWPEIATITTNLTNMTKDVGEIKDMIKEWFAEFRSEFKQIRDEYATKKEVENNKNEIEILKKENINTKLLIAKYSWWVIVIASIATILINKLF